MTGETPVSQFGGRLPRESGLIIKVFIRTLFLFPSPHFFVTITNAMNLRNGFLPFDRDSEVHRSRRKLPHWEQAGCTYFVTFRLGDSIPAVKLKQWKEERDNWRDCHPEPWSPREWQEYQDRFLSRIVRWSDAGWGACLLRNPGARQIVYDAFLFFEGDRYAVDQFVIMPNHVHLLVCLLDGWSLAKVLHSWKSFTAHEINKLLGRSGMVWMDERFDHIVRSAAQRDHFRRYIAANPLHARLPEGDFTLWGREG